MKFLLIIALSSFTPQIDLKSFLFSYSELTRALVCSSTISHTYQEDEITSFHTYAADSPCSQWITFFSYRVLCMCINVKLESKPGTPAGVPPLHNISIDSEVFLGLCFSNSSLYFYNVYTLDSMTDCQSYRCCSNATFSSDNGDNTTIILHLYWHIFPDPHEMY